MKYCPTCQTRYDEEILRFCMKDGSPLIEEDEPAFIQMPSESIDEADEDDLGEVTVIRKNVPAPPPPPNAIDEISFTPDPRPSSERIVVPTTDEPAAGQARARVIPPYQPPYPPKSNTAKVVVLTIIGTLAVLALGALAFRFLQNDSADNSNINTNFNSNIVNTNVNTNLGFDSNFNFNVNANFNTNSLSNINTNTGIRTPTPTPKPSPSAQPSVSPSPDDDGTPTPTRTPAPTQTPIVVRPNPTPTTPRMNPLPANRPANGGVLNGRALELPTPAYPQIAKQMRASGEVRVQVAVDEQGNVVSAHAISGHPLLRQSAEMAARRSKIRSNGRYESGELVYNFKGN